eukprot:gene21204-27469_t
MSNINIWSNDKDEKNKDEKNKEVLPNDFQDWNINDNPANEEVKVTPRRRPLSADYSRNRKIDDLVVSSPIYKTLEKSSIDISDRSLISSLSKNSDSFSRSANASPARKVSFSTVVSVAEFSVDLEPANDTPPTNISYDDDDDDFVQPFLSRKQNRGPLQRLRQFDDENIEMQESCCNECKVS